MVGNAERERILERIRGICLVLPETSDVGHRGWLGVRLDRELDWDELTGIVEDAFAEIAPRALVEAA